MSVWFFSSLPNNEYSNLLSIIANSSKYFSGKTSSPVKNSYLLTFFDDEAEILGVCYVNHTELSFAPFLLSTIFILWLTAILL